MQHEETTNVGRVDSVGGSAARHPSPDGKFSTTVNAVALSFTDPTPSGAHILGMAELKPADDYVLIQLMGRGTRSIGLEETVDLRAPGTETFRAFQSDRIFRFTLNDLGFDWGVAKISESELRAIGHVREEEVIALERGGEDVDLKPGDILDLADAGTEHLHTEKRLITVFFENRAQEIPRGVYSTEKLKQLFSVQQGYILEVINREGQLTPLKPGEQLRVRDGMKFFEQVPCGASS